MIFEFESLPPRYLRNGSNFQHKIVGCTTANKTRTNSFISSRIKRMERLRGVLFISASSTASHTNIPNVTNTSIEWKSEQIANATAKFAFWRKSNRLCNFDRPLLINRFAKCERHRLIIQMLAAMPTISTHTVFYRLRRKALFKNTFQQNSISILKS